MLTPREVASELKVSEKTVMKWLRKGTLKGTKLGKLMADKRRRTTKVYRARHERR